MYSYHWIAKLTPLSIVCPSNCHCKNTTKPTKECDPNNDRHTL